MKRLVIFTSLIIVSFFAYTVISGKSGNSKDGIKFFEGTWDEALKKANAENKPIFLDIYASWCGPCKMLKRKTFSAKEVGDYFNASYVNLSFDGEVGEGVLLANKFHITGYPTLIILNKNGTLLSMQAGYISPDELLVYGKQSYRK